MPLAARGLDHAAGGVGNDPGPEVFWRHTVRGEVWRWTIDGTPTVTETFVRTVGDTDFEIRCAGDQDGDGNTDLFWRNRATGALYWWPMDGATPRAEVYAGVVSIDYDIAGTGDFDGDGKTDLLWRNVLNGEAWIWLMDGAARLSEVYIGRADLSYAIRGVGDLNADGKADIVWHHATLGEVWVWLMDGTTRLAEAYVAAVPDTTYRIQDVADFDGDGRADLLWSNAARGDVWIWRMNGAAPQSETYVATVPDTEYRVAGVRDYDGNGTPDLLWHHASRGEVWVWTMDGTRRVAETWVATVPDVGYQIVRSRSGAVAARPARLEVTRFLAFGDSLTWGKVSPPANLIEGELVPPPASYPTQLASLLGAAYPQQPVTVVNEGLPGEWIDDGLSRFAAALETSAPEAVLLLDGANDLLGDPGSATTEYIAGKLREMVQVASLYVPRDRVLLALFPPQYHGAVPYDKGAGAEFVPELNARIAAVALDEGATLVDLNTPLSADIMRFIGADGLHPTEEGYALIAQTFARMIQARFEILLPVPYPY